MEKQPEPEPMWLTYRYSENQGGIRSACAFALAMSEMDVSFPPEVIARLPEWAQANFVSTEPKEMPEGDAV